MKKQWNKDIRDQLKDFPKKAPEGLLDDIKSEMMRRGLSPSPVADKPKHLYPQVFRRVASVAAVLLILLGLSLLWKKPATLPVVSEYPDVYVTEKKTQEEKSLAIPSANLIAKAEKKAVSPSAQTNVKEEENTALQEEEAKDKEEKQPQDKETQETNNECR